MKKFCSTFILLFAFGVANAQQPRPSAPPRARNDAGRKISGRVIDEAGRPVLDASIMAMPAGKSEDPRQVMMNFRTASTDEAGKFEFAELSTGAYRLTAYASGYVLAPDSVEEGGRPKYFRPGDVVTLRLVKGGVITGTVLDALGEPMVAARVRAHRIKDEKGRPAMTRVSLDEGTLSKEWKTDDRGIYRIYGLEPGSYIVSAGGKGLNPMSIGAFDADAPTYHPTGTRDMAAPIALQAGQEVSNIDIRYRDNKGYIISGRVTSPNSKAGAPSVWVVTLTNAATGNIEGLGLSGFMGGRENGSPFSLVSVGEGEYNVTAMSMGNGMESADVENLMLSPPRRVTVKGADVTGLELVLAPVSTISGQFVVEKLKATEGIATCQPKPAAIEGTVIAARSDAKKKTGGPVFNFSPFLYTSDGVPDDKGEFRILAMEAGRYRFDIKLPSEDWYIHSLTLAKELPKETAKEETAKAESAREAKPKPATAATAPRDLARPGLTIKMGERINGVKIVAAEGAAAVKGQIKPEKEGEQLQLRIFLVPAEPEDADNLLRFYQADVQRDNTFSITNITPGRYLALLRAVSEEEANAVEARPVSWNDDDRVTLRLEALSANRAVDLASCQRLSNLTLTYSSTSPAKKVEQKKGQK